jgi:hypothetical protein
VKLVQGTARGEQPRVQKVTTADLDALTAGTFQGIMGIVDWSPSDSLAVDFRTAGGPSATLAGYAVESDVMPYDAADIAKCAQVNVWFNKPVIAFYSNKLDASLAPTVAREADVAGFIVGTGLIAKYNSGAVTGEENPLGVVYRVDGPEVTVIFTKI